VTRGDGKGGHYIADPVETTKVLAEVDDAGFTPGKIGLLIMSETNGATD